MSHGRAHWIVSSPGIFTQTLHQTALLSQEAKVSLPEASNVSLIAWFMGTKPDPLFYMIYIYYPHVNNEKTTHWWKWSTINF